MSYPPTIGGEEAQGNGYQAYINTMKEKRDEEDFLSSLDGDERVFERNHRPTDLDLSGTEQSSVDTPIAKTNVGYKLLEKMGWKEGTGLGRNGTGRVDPIRHDDQLGFMGLGKWQLDMDYAEVALAERRKLEVEVEDTEARKTKREAAVAKQDATAAELKKINEVFYCDICNKGYTKVSDWENHLSSYDHHHVKRFKEMKEAMKNRNQSQGENLKKKEKKRMEKELQKLSEFATRQAQAAGRINQSPVMAQGPVKNTTPSIAISKPSFNIKPIGFKPIDSVPAPKGEFKSSEFKPIGMADTMVNVATRQGFVQGGIVAATFASNDLVKELQQGVAAVNTESNTTTKPMISEPDSQGNKPKPTISFGFSMGKKPSISKG
eukprot:Ihof_evm6s58 gene=Ihof_evmTU6s58